jgi:exonuclease SbcC
LRPLRLEVEGFTSFREPAALDFEGLDLFAITGPTGAGKSSLIDAVVFALYGQVPRVGREYKQLISHGAERLSVRLDFEVGGRRYRAARTARLAGNPQTVLERRTGEGFEPLAGRVKEIEEAIQGIVGLDYEAFTRSVVLPQGQFDAFLKGEPKERHKILVALLNLDLYVEMQKIAHRRAAEAKREAEFIGAQLDSDYRDATEETLRAREEELGAAEAARSAAERALSAVDEALAVARQVAAARREAEAAERDLEAQLTATAKAQSTLAEADGRRSAQARAQKDVLERLAAVPFDAARQEALLPARPRAEQLLELEPRRRRLGKASADQRLALEKATKRLAQAEKALPEHEKDLAGAGDAALAARAERETLHRRQAALELRRSLSPGEACPVCEQVVKTVPAGRFPGLEQADAAVRKAEKREAEARKAAETARLELERARSEAQRAVEQGEEILRHEKELQAETRAIGEALEKAGVKPLERTDPASLLARLERELDALDKARAQRERLEAEKHRLEADAARLEKAVAAAQAQLEAAKGRVAEIESRRAEAEKRLESAARCLAMLGERHGWALPAPGAAKGGETADEAGWLEARRQTLTKERSEAERAAARLETLLSRLRQDVARAAELRARKAALETKAALAHTLAQHLRSDQLLAYVQEEALRLLAEDGSRHLEALSLGRYSLVASDQEFAVVDHWNADASRSVKTLSGGETFLASLALALALAEGLAELAVAGRAGETLESLFLDEGFGTLDPETLGQVVQALDALHGGRRLVGVVTHLPELAAQLPARVEVQRTEGTARLRVG